jgi:uncharacterized membrane protein YozB (DUF420 family)
MAGTAQAVIVFPSLGGGSVMSATFPGFARTSSERLFYAAMTAAMFVTVFVGFSRSFFLRPFFPDFPAPAESFFALHGIVFAAWCVLLVAQSSLVTAGRTDLHRQLGGVGVLLALGMIVLGVYGALLAAARPTGFVGIPVPALQFLAVPVFDMALFAAFVALAVVRRHDAQSHKRWMLLASVNLLTAAIARWPGVIEIGNPFVYFALADLFVVALAAWDLKSRGRLHPATLWGGLAIVVSQPLRLAVSGTAAWAVFAEWAMRLVA